MEFYDEEDVIWKYFKDHMVQDIISYQIKKASSHEKKEFEKTLENLIPVISHSKVSIYMSVRICAYIQLQPDLPDKIAYLIF